VLKECFIPFCLSLHDVMDDEERTRAFSGLVAVLQADSSLVLGGVGGLGRSGHVFNFVSLCSSWNDPPSEPLLSQLSVILRAIMEALGPQNWQTILNVFEGGSNKPSHLIDMFRLR